MIRALDTLSADETAAIGALVSASEAFDAASSCIQFDHGLNFRKNIPGWFLAEEHGRINGIASVFAPMEGEAEISVCVAPEARGRGLGDALYRAARAAWACEGAVRHLLVCDRRSKPGLAFADGRALGLYRKAGFEVERSVAYFIAKDGAMIDGLNIRDARPGDEAALARLADQLGYPAQADTVAARIVKYFRNPEERVIVAELDGGVIAWTSVALVDHFYTPRCVEISGLVVDAGLRGRGIGAALLAEAKRWAAGLGVATVRLRANVIRAEAHRFYERQGFARVKQQIVFETAAAPSDAGGARGE